METSQLRDRSFCLRVSLLFVWESLSTVDGNTLELRPREVLGREIPALRMAASSRACIRQRFEMRNGGKVSGSSARGRHRLPRGGLNGMKNRPQACLRDARSPSETRLAPNARSFFAILPVLYSASQFLGNLRDRRNAWKRVNSSAPIGTQYRQ